MHGSSSSRHDAPVPEARSLLAQGLRAMTRFGSRRPLFTLWFIVLSASIAAAFSFLCLDFKTERSDLLDPSAEYHKRWLKYSQSFGEAADIVVVVEGDDPEAIRSAMEELGTRMARESALFQKVMYKVAAGSLRSKGLQFLSPAQLQRGLQQIAEYSPVLQGRWDLIQLESLFPRLQYQVAARTASNEPAGVRSASDLKPVLNHAQLLSTSLASYIEDSRGFKNPWPTVLPSDTLLGDVGDEMYFLNEQKTMGFIKALPAKKDGNFSGDSKSISRVRELIAEAGVIHPDVRIGITGVPVLEADEMSRSQLDMLLSTGVSLLGIAALLFVGFRGFRHPLIGMAMLAVGMAWAFGFTTISVGHLNILSVSFAVMLIGLGIDFAVVFISRYLQHRHEGKQLRTALLEATDGVGTGILTAAVTTALAFFCATLTDFRGIAELGIVAGGGILLCALAAFCTLPAMIATADRDVEPKQLPNPFEGRILRRITSNYPIPALAVSSVLVLAACTQIFRFEDGKLTTRVKYDYNLLNLQAKGVESVDLEQRIFDESGNSLLYAVSVADSPQEARALHRKFAALSSVHHVEDLASRMPGTPSPETRQLIQMYQSQLAMLPDRPPMIAATDPAAVGQAVENLYVSLRELKIPAARKAAKQLDRFLDKFESLNLRQQMEFLTRYQYAMSAALLGQFQALRMAASNLQPIHYEDLPAELRERFVSSDGKWLIQVYPSEQVWDEAPLRRFVNDVRSVDPDATGVPLQNYEASGQIKESYKTAGSLAFAVICLVLLVDFLDPRYKFIALGTPLLTVGAVAAILISRRAQFDELHLLTAYVLMAISIAAVLDPRNLRDAALALLPPGLGMLMLFGFLGLLRIDLNPANLIVVPLVLGTGVDFGIHVLHNFREKRGAYEMSSSTMNSILLTSATSVIGFGSLMLAAHRGLFGIGLVYSIGLAGCLLISLVMLPAILTLISRNKLAATTAEPRRSEKSTKSRAA